LVLVPGPCSFGLFFALLGGATHTVLKHFAGHCVDHDLNGFAFVDDIERVAKAGAAAFLLKFRVGDLMGSENLYYLGYR
jgi:hypothetical protein